MIFYGKGGQQYNLPSTPIKAGGEGEIYNVSRKPGLVAKIYKNGKATAVKERKLSKMVGYQIDPKMLKQIAWPQDILYDSKGQFTGFIMPKMAVNEDLNVIYEYGSSAKYPDMPWESRIIIAQNLCAVLDTIHSSGHVCGDLNPKNISVDPKNGYVVFLDTDSYHIQDGTTTYRCDVGIPEYLPVEIQTKMRGGVTLATASLPTFTQDTDNFALAIHIFQLLMNGVHPFTCAIIPSHSSVTAPQPSDNIEKGAFPFMQNIPGIRIPVYAPEITILPERIKDLFKRGFIDGHKYPSARPKPGEWHTALADLRKNLINCKKTIHHQYSNNLSSCPWCAVNERFLQSLQPKGGALPQTLIKPPIVPPGVTAPTISTTSFVTKAILVGLVLFGIPLLVQQLAVPSVPRQNPAVSDQNLPAHGETFTDRFVHSDGLNVRARPNRESDERFRVFQNTIIKVSDSDRSGDWVKINYGTNEGYVNYTYLRDFRITEIMIGDQDSSGNWRVKPGDALRGSSIQYLGIQARFETLNNYNASTAFRIKIYDPDEILRNNSNSSPQGYTYETSVIISSSELYNLGGWGSSSGGYYYPGSWRIEIWYESPTNRGNTNYRIATRTILLE